MKISILSALIVISQNCCQASGSCVGDCCRAFRGCPSELLDYFSTYSETNCKGFYVRDGIKTQITFMNQKEVKESFRPSYKGSDLTNIDVHTFATTVKSLIEVIRMKMVYQEFNNLESNHYQVIVQILNKVAEESCLWLNAASISIATNCADINFTQLEAVYSRLDFYDTVSNAESSMLRIYPQLKYVHPIDLCAWMNGRVLDNCMDAQTYNNTVRDTLNTFYKGKPCKPQLCFLNSEQ